MTEEFLRHDPMAEQHVVLVDRDPRTRPRASWRDAWADSRGHDLSTLGTWRYYARGTIEHGGVLALALPFALGIIAFASVLAVAFLAALLAGTGGAGSTSRGALLILASVVISQALTAARVGQKSRRIFITAHIRVAERPRGWGTAWIRVTVGDARAARTALLTGAFSHVETSYYRGGAYATLAAYFRLTPDTPHAEMLVADALGSATPYLTTGISLSNSE